MSKVSYEQKIELIERYKKRPMGVTDPEVLTAIQVDVVKAASKGGRRGGDDGAQQPSAPGVYNHAMGIYRTFMQRQNVHLNLEGKKAKDYSEAMNSLINYMRSFQRMNGKPSDDAAVLRGITFLFAEDSWKRLPDFHKNRVGLPDIYNKIEEILIIIRDGKDKKSADKTALDNLEHRLRNGGQ
jgi:hypothetical protein